MFFATTLLIQTGFQDNTNPKQILKKRSKNTGENTRKKTRGTPTLFNRRLFCRRDDDDDDAMDKEEEEEEEERRRRGRGKKRRRRRRRQSRLKNENKRRKPTRTRYNTSRRRRGDDDGELRNAASNHAVLAMTSPIKRRFTQESVDDDQNIAFGTEDSSNREQEVV